VKTNLRGCGVVFAVALMFAAGPALLSAAGAQVILSSVTPAAAEPGLTTVHVLGSGFPAGNFTPANIKVSLAPASGGASTTASATNYQPVVGTTSSVAFVLPASISVTAPTVFSISIATSLTAFRATSRFRSA
jgi:hypothetical protein